MNKISNYRKDYDPTKTEFINDTDEFNGIVTKNETEGNYDTSVIDKAVKVTTVSEKIKQQALGSWNSSRKWSIALITFGAIGIPLSAVAVVAAAVVFAVSGIFTLAAIATVGGVSALFLLIGLSSIATLALGIVKKNKAGREAGKWQENDPVAQAIIKRKLGVDCMNYPDIKELQGSIFGEEEVNKLSDEYDKEITRRALGKLDTLHVQFHSDYTIEGSHPQIVDNFFDNNPLAEDQLKEAFRSDQDLAERMGQLTASYEALELHFNGIKNTASSRCLEITRSFESRKEELKTARNQALAPSEAWKTLTIESLNRKKEQKLLRVYTDRSMARPTYIQSNVRSRPVTRMQTVPTRTKNHVIPRQRSLQRAPVMEPISRRRVAHNTAIGVEQMGAAFSRRVLILEEYQEKKKMIEQQYALFAEPANRQYEKNLIELQANERQLKANVDNWNKREKAKLFEPIKELLEAYKTKQFPEQEKINPIPVMEAPVVSQENYVYKFESIDLNQLSADFDKDLEQAFDSIPDDEGDE